MEKMARAWQSQRQGRASVYQAVKWEIIVCTFQAIVRGKWEK